MNDTESTLEAAYREIHEELGITADKVKPLPLHKQPNKTFDYERSMFKDGQRFDGQRQQYVVFHWPSASSIPECNLHVEEVPEFTDVKWASWEELQMNQVPNRTFIYDQLKHIVQENISTA
eukprot:TRINITY_DN554_c0_g1_i2.p1 TRINITY_DN554_c0_g1~~TRINITY_DN554_c0_g1_i2.p1  ORF type:complete len:121 (+),score=26.71 TRINITY_DN554_c0_g1_i2:538-900(+)